jgi:hypothetical protein
LVLEEGVDGFEPFGGAVLDGLEYSSASGEDIVFGAVQGYDVATVLNVKSKCYFF